MSLKNIKIFFLSIFRKLLVYHHTSLEFRAKLFASMIASNKIDDNYEYIELQKIAKEVYRDDEYRVDVLVHITKEYVNKITQKNSLNIDCLLKDIDSELKRHKRFIKKIDMKHLRRFYSQDADEKTKILQTRILEFYENEIKSRETDKG